MSDNPLSAWWMNALNSVGNALQPQRPNPLASLIASNPVGTSVVAPQLTNATPIDTRTPVQRQLADAMPIASTLALGMVGDAPGIKAFHGSPYDFDSFDAAKIGTGEGHQAYGHGLYFAGNEDVANTYKGVQGNASNDPMANIAQKTLQSGGNPTKILQQIFPKASDDEIGSAIARAKAPDNGRMYEVQLNVQPHNLLDWDRPVTEQPNANTILSALKDNAEIFIDSKDTQTQNAAKDILSVLRRSPENFTGESAWKSLVRLFGGNAEAAARSMQGDAGMHGIQYLDQGSRLKREGTRNYVIFDPSMVQIMRKYAVPGFVAGSAIPAAMGGSQQ